MMDTAPLRDAYRALALQLQLCMGMNRQARRSRETLLGDALRHRRILELIEGGDTEGLRRELVHHGDKTFLLDADHNFPGGSPESLAWLESVRRLAEAHDGTTAGSRGDGRPGG